MGLDDHCHSDKGMLSWEDWESLLFTRRRAIPLSSLLSLELLQMFAGAMRGVEEGPLYDHWHIHGSWVIQQQAYPWVMNCAVMSMPIGHIPYGDQQAHELWTI